MHFKACAKVVSGTTLYYNTCTKHFPVLLCTTTLAQSTSQYYFVLQSLRKARPSTTLYFKACTSFVPVLLCTTKLTQSISQYYFVEQSLHKARPSTTLYYEACTKHFPVVLCTTKLVQSSSQYYFVLQSLRKAICRSFFNYKACTKHFPVQRCSTQVTQKHFPVARAKFLHINKVFVAKGSRLQSGGLGLDPCSPWVARRVGIASSSGGHRRVGVASLIPCLWGKLQNLSFSNVSTQLVMCVAGVAFCDIPTCLITCRKCQNWRRSRTKCLVLLRPGVSSRVSGFPVASPCLWGKLQNRVSSRVSAFPLASPCLWGKLKTARFAAPTSPCLWAKPAGS